MRMNKKRAFEIIANFSRSKVLVVGDMMVDHFIWGKVSRISPEAPVPVLEVHSDNLLLGGCANVLNNIYSLGCKVYGSGVVGADEMGKRLLDEFHKRNISTEGIIVESDRPTTIKTRIIAHSQQVVRFDRESREPVQQKSIERMIEYIKTVRADLGAIVISDYNKGVITKPLLDGIRDLIADRSIVVCVDPKQSDFSLYQGFDVITPNHYEAGQAIGIEDIKKNKVEKGNGIYEAVRAILAQFHLKAMLITRGEEGMSLLEENGKVVHIPARAREVFDVTGAGDTVIGVFALSLAAGATFREAAILANHAAGVVVGKVGTATVSPEELRKALCYE
ncbi:MAG: D-glycero-beta-D-manno-heptose-7-phosphate kinase [Syntrophobacterales bacterium CG_4_9_14_3_um_filter_49_8]|nr:MAG: D-glycero-beta-D-manno-heptose-7-phosphate kinase [Syntrophobacterales bacterium CG_4_9_14_3_um_filter_49_8]